MAAAPPPELVDRARDLYEQGAPLADIGRAVERSDATISQWAKRHGWERPAGYYDSPEQKRAAPAQSAAVTRWAERRAQEADAAGATAAFTRAKVVEFLNNGDARAAKDAAITYGILVEKAQLLTGAATARTEHSDLDSVDRAIAGLLDDMDRRGAGRIPEAVPTVAGGRAGADPR